MVFTLMMVLYVVLAVFMIGLILVQRGAGAAAGSGFGAGASATVFGARGASSFLTKATKWLAICFFILTLGLAMYVQRTGLASRAPSESLGVMSSIAADARPPAVEAVDGEVPLAPATQAGDTEVPAAVDAPVETAEDEGEGQE